MGLLDGKVAVITGASKGIGRVMSRLFAKEGAAVGWAARSGALGVETAALVTKAGGGAIVNISSGAGRRGLPYRIGYCSAKAGQVGMTFGMALELAPHNITVNCVAPGAIEGDRIDRVIEGQAKQRGITPEAMRKAMLERSPLKRMATADDISAAAMFLCSPLARNISGQVLPANAGEPPA